MKYSNIAAYRYRCSWCILICAFWTLGIVGGALLSRCTILDIAVVAKAIPITPPSSTRLILMRLCFVLLAILLLRYLRPLYVVLILAVSASYSYVISLLTHSFGSAGWLVSFLILAPDALLLAFLTFCGISKSFNRACSIEREFAILSVLTCAVSLLECHCIAPFTLALF